MECFSGDTEVLTPGGWVALSNLPKEAEVAEYNTQTEEISFSQPLRYVHYKDREVLSYEDRNTSLIATPNHNMLTKWNRAQTPLKHHFEDVSVSRGNAFIGGGLYKNKPKLSEAEARYLAMFLADGSMSKEGYVIFCFSKTRKIERCRSVLSTLGVPFTERVHKRKEGVLNYSFYVGKRTNSILTPYTGRDKTLSWKALHELPLEEFLDEATYWDATPIGYGVSFRIVSTNYQTMEVLQAMCALTNRGCVIREDRSVHKKSQGAHKVAYYITYRKKATGMSYMGDKSAIRSAGTQDVYCVTMPKGTVVVRHKGKISIQGNCDYSQAELRVAADLCGDENMIGAYLEGSDLHERTMGLIFGDNISDDPEVHKRQRTRSKIANFSLIYGAVPSSLVKYAKGWGVDIPLEEAEELHKKFFEAYPKLLTWYEECKNFTRRNGYIQSPSGRKRYLYDIWSDDWKLKSSAERQCINSPVQGFASDCCITALADIVFSDKLDHSKCRVLGSVHDAILVEIKEGYEEEATRIMQEHMANPSLLEDIDMKVPLVADVEIGSGWGAH